MNLTQEQRQALDLARFALRQEATSDPHPDFDRHWRDAFRHALRTVVVAFPEEAGQ